MLKKVKKAKVSGQKTSLRFTFDTATTHEDFGSRKNKINKTTAEVSC